MGGHTSIESENGHEVFVDPYNNALYIMSDLHQKTHEGKSFNVCNIFESVVDNGIADVLIITGAKLAHTISDVSVGGDAYIYIYEGTTTSNNGTTLTAVNKNRLSSTSATVTAYHTPTVTGVGTLLHCEYIPGGQKVHAGGGTGGIAYENILAINTKYLFRITNKSGAVKNFSQNILWYEN